MDNNQRLQRLRTLYSKLSDADLRASEIYLREFYEQYTTKDSSYLVLFDAISSGKSFEEICKDESIASSEDGLRKNIERLEEKINEIITLPVNVHRRTNTLDKVDKDFIRCLNYIQAYKIRAQIGDLYGGVRVLRKALKLSRRLELFDFSSYCLNQLAAVSKFRMMPMKSIEFSKEMRDLEIQRLNYSKSSGTRMATFKFYLIDTLNSRQMNELESSIKDLEALDNTPYSASVDRNVLYTSLLYYDKRRDYKKCLEVCERLKDVIKSNYAIHKIREAQTIEVNLALFYVLDKEFERSNNTVNELLVQTNVSDINRSFCSLIKCRNLLYLKENQESLAFALELIEEPWLSPIYKTQLSIILAYLWFLQGDYKSAISELLNLGELKKDKSGWNLYARILLILSYKLSGNLDTVENEIENFRRYLHGKELSSRVKRHARITLNGFSNFISPAESEDEWNPTSAEVVDFDELFRISL